MRVVLVFLVAALAAACVTTESVQFRPKAQQEALVRDGQAALISRRKSSLILIKPAARQFQSGARPVFIVGITNLTNAPLEFRMGNIEVAQIVNQQAMPLKVFTYEDLLAEEKNRQIAAAIIGGVAVA